MCFTAPRVLKAGTGALQVLSEQFSDPLFFDDAASQIMHCHSCPIINLHHHKITLKISKMSGWF